MNDDGVDERGILMADQLDPMLPTVLALGGLHQQIGMPPFEFFRVLQSIEVNRIFVRDLQRSFYHGGVPELGSSIEEIVRSIEELVPDPSRTLIVGTSGGGYAGLLASSFTGIRCLAIAPVVSLRRLDRLRFLDHRWGDAARLARKFARTQGEDTSLRRLLSTSALTNALVCFPSRNRVDLAHAEFLRDAPGVELLPISSKRHDVIREMRDDGTLGRFLREELERLGS